MTDTQLMRQAVERLAYERGYQAGVESMFDQWCNLRSQLAQYKAEVCRLQQILEERAFQ